ncbi:VOC family protein [Luteolibacter marinus]|uniref:VOC family protein n=1 Tax=Luteolibacter marinus TaxID=2776705 RepID=UPI001866BC10|nr:VOC family protein [Luteolibacter marinus]
MSCPRNPVGWFEIYVTDMARSRKFYETVLAIEMQPLPLPDGSDDGFELMMFPNDMEHQAPGCGGALCRMEGFTPGAGGTLVYFSCEDCGVEASRVSAAGGELFREKFSIAPYGFIALFLDPDGNMAGLHSMK